MTARYEKGDEPVPGYRLEAFLGQGAFGTVWKVLGPGRTEAALKIISLSGKQGLKEFRALRLVKRIRHPNLVPINAFWLKDEGGHVLDDATAIDDLDKRASMGTSVAATMICNLADSPKPCELVIAMGLGEKDLSRRLDECRSEGLQGIPVGELLGYMEDSARAIDYLNRPRTSAGSDMVAVQHCDIKPFNIMIVGGAAQVCDFGLARMLGDVRKTATAAGTVAYVAPECLSNCEPSVATDQYSLAITYVELRTGKLPYRSESFADVVNAVMKGDLNLELLSGPEREVIRRATALDPFQRYPSTMEMVQALRKAVELAGSGVDLAPKRSYAASVLIGLVVIALAGGGAWYGWKLSQPDTGTKSVVSNDPVTKDVVPTGHEPKKDVVATADVESPEPPKSDVKVVTSEPTKTDTPVVMKTDTPPPVDVLTPAIAKAKKFMEARNFETAIETLNHAIERTSIPSAEAFLLRGTCYLEEANPEEAVRDLTRAIDLDAKDPKGFSRRAAAYRALGKNKTAIEDLTQAINLDPFAGDYLSRAEAYWVEGDDHRAMADLDVAIQLAPESAEAYVWRGRVRFDQRQWAKSLEDFNAALDREPSNAEAMANAARLLATVPDPAIRDGNRALELAARACQQSNWQDSIFLDVLAAAHAELSHFDEAVKFQQQAIDKESNTDLKDEFQSRLSQYKKRRAYRQP